MIRALTAYAVTLVVFLAVDAAWLILVAVDLFRAQLGPILRPEPMVAAIAVFYPLYALGLTCLAVLPMSGAQGPTGAAGRGALLGLTAYATFDLTNLAILRDWTIGLAVIDTAWGTFASALAALLGRWAFDRVGQLRSSP
jgi:uncharacterized membrane protein